jgi:F0F1-type ATP synthase alpha subunit
MVGRVVNTLGFPIDGKGPMVVTYTKCLWKENWSYLPSTSY